MEMKYEFDDNHSLTGVTFDGLCGREYVTSVKAALNMLQVKNPALVFQEDVRKGIYDDMPEDEFQNNVNMIGRLKNFGDIRMIRMMAPASPR